MKNYLFVCSRNTFNIANNKWIIGFHDNTSTVNSELQTLETGDRVFFYITKEKIVTWPWIIQGALFYDDETVLYDNLRELCVRRIHISIPTVKSYDFTKLIDKLDLIKKKTGVVWSAYLVKNFIRLSENDTKVIEESLDKNL